MWVVDQDEISTTDKGGMKLHKTENSNKVSDNFELRT